MQMQKLDGTVLGNHDWEILKNELHYPYTLAYVHQTLLMIELDNIRSRRSCWNIPKNILLQKSFLTMK
jgi:hypothetical protein